MKQRGNSIPEVLVGTVVVCLALLFFFQLARNMEDSSRGQLVRHDVEEVFQRTVGMWRAGAVVGNVDGTMAGNIPYHLQATQEATQTPWGARLRLRVSWSLHRTATDWDNAEFRAEMIAIKPAAPF